MSRTEVRVLMTAAPGVILWPGGAVQVEATVPPVAVYALAAVAEQAGFGCTVLDPVDYWRTCRTGEQLETLVAAHTVFCLSANSTTWPLAAPLVERAARVDPRPLIVVGGLHPTYCDEHVLRTSQVDVVVRGEGERTLPELLRAQAAGRSLATVPGLSLLVDGALVRTPDPAPLTPEELSAAPLPLWERLPPLVYGFIPVESSRGCRFGCSFCSIEHKHGWRPLSLDAIAARLEQAGRQLDRVTYRTVMLTDDCFTTDRPRVAEVTRLVEQLLPGVGIGLEARADNVLDRGLLASLERLELEFIQIGVECGYAEGLRRVHKGISVEQVVASTHALHSIGRSREAKYSYIVGFPWESEADMKRTMAFAMSLGSRYGNHVQINWLLVVPGSEVYDQLAAEGRVSAADFDVLPTDRPTLFRRTHPTVELGTAAAIQEYAALLEQSYPWVSTLGSVFRSWTRHPHLPLDRAAPQPAPTVAGASSRERDCAVAVAEMPPVLQAVAGGG